MMIDFVVTWVDGNDSDFLAEKRKYSGKNEQENNETNGDCRFRSETDMLRFWFRGVEKYAPWVHKIHFVTCGQKPDWLDESHPLLNLVNHQDFIPEQYLPTFNSNTIELNFHRIKRLTEQFVLFNDDMYLLKPVAPEFFFKDGAPVLDTDLRYPRYVSCMNWCRHLFNDYCLVNMRFDMRKSIWEHRRKWFNLKELGFKRTRQNLTCYIANKTLPVGNYGHLALPHLKSTFEEIWSRDGKILDACCQHRFRTDDQQNQWLCCAWNQAKGKFYPALEKNLGVRVVITPKKIDWACELIRNQSVPQICTNDTVFNTDYTTSCVRLFDSFSSVFPEKSSFEKYDFCRG